MLRLRALHTDEKTIVSTRGDIDLANARWFETELNRQIDMGETFLIVNLAHTSYMDSSGLAALLRVHRALESCGGKLVVIGCQPSLTRVLTMVGFDHLFQIQELLPSRLRRIQR